MIGITLDKLDDTAEVVVEDGRAVIDVTSASGIGGLRADLVEGEWPAEVLVRLRLAGLERLEVGFGHFIVTTSVSSTGDPAPPPTVYRQAADGETKAIADAGEAFYPTVRIVPEAGSRPAIPLRNGYFEIELPPAFYAGEPAAFTLQWIDFYR